MSELKPCPFCGANAELNHNSQVDRFDHYSIRCSRKSCQVRPETSPADFASMNRHISYKSMINSIEKIWNTRISPNKQEDK